jgi:cytochrome P450
MWAFVDGLVKDREASGERDPDALLDTLIAAKNAGSIDDTDIRFIILTLFFGGYDTSKNQLTMLMSLLLDRPEIYARCAEDRDYCGKVVRESLRHSSIASPFRQVARDFTYKGHTFRKDETLLMAPPLANRDPEVFADPEVFDPERENAGRHVAFGRGVHNCIGQFLVLAQMQEGLHLIAQRLRNPRLTGKRVWRPFIGAWGLASLPIAFDPA